MTTCRTVSISISTWLIKLTFNVTLKYEYKKKNHDNKNEIKNNSPRWILRGYKTEITISSEIISNQMKKHMRKLA